MQSWIWTLKNNKWNASFKNITILVPSLVIQTTFFSYCIKAIAEKTSAHMLLSILNIGYKIIFNTFAAILR